MSAMNRILKFFSSDHLPETLAAVSKLFGDVAVVVDSILPDSAEKTVALRKLLEAKDAAVRAKVEELDDSGELDVNVNVDEGGANEPNDDPDDPGEGEDGAKIEDTLGDLGDDVNKDKEST